jgi:HEAT repeat protein
MNRFGAARALGQIRDRRAVDPLIKALDDEDGLIAGDVATALGKIGDTRAVMPLIKLLAGDPEKQRAVAAAHALGNFNDPRAIRPLVNALFTVKGDHRPSQNAAIESLKRIRHADVVAVLAERAAVEPTSGGALMARKAVGELTGNGIGFAYHPDEFRQWWNKIESLYRESN